MTNLIMVTSQIKAESTKMDDLKAKAIAIGEELLQKGEKILNELKMANQTARKMASKVQMIRKGTGSKFWR